MGEVNENTDLKFIFKNADAIRNRVVADIAGITYEQSTELGYSTEFAE